MAISLFLQPPATTSPQMPRRGRLMRALDRIGLAGRSRRVTLLITGIVLLSIADLMVTLAYARGGGMMEANPIVVYLVKVTQSPLSLACYKLLTVTVCVSLLFRLRKYAVSEAAAWCGVAILACMSFMWHNYSAQVQEPETLSLVRGDGQCEHWLVFE